MIEFYLRFLYSMWIVQLTVYTVQLTVLSTVFYFIYRLEYTVEGLRSVHCTVKGWELKFSVSRAWKLITRAWRQILYQTVSTLSSSPSPYLPPSVPPCSVATSLPPSISPSLPLPLLHYLPLNQQTESKAFLKSESLTL